MIILTLLIISFSTISYAMEPRAFIAAYRCSSFTKMLDCILEKKPGVKKYIRQLPEDDYKKMIATIRMNPVFDNKYTNATIFIGILGLVGQFCAVWNYNQCEDQLCRDYYVRQALYPLATTFAAKVIEGVNEYTVKNDLLNHLTSIRDNTKNV